PGVVRGALERERRPGAQIHRRQHGAGTERADDRQRRQDPQRVAHVLATHHGRSVPTSTAGRDRARRRSIATATAGNTSTDSTPAPTSAAAFSGSMDPFASPISL